MAHSFTVTPLRGSKFLVEGTDVTGTSGRTVLYSPAWAALLAYAKRKGLVKNWDEEFQAMFKGLLDVAEKIEEADADEYGTVVLTEAVEGVEGQSVTLDQDGIILNLIDHGRGDLLRWVDNSLYALV